MNQKQKLLLLRIIFAAALFAAGMILKFTLHLDAAKYILPAFFGAAMLCAGADVIINALAKIFKGQLLDESFLMTVATFGAMIIGEYPEAAGVMIFYQIGELFQSVAVGKSRRSISELMNLRPDTANLLIDGEVKTVDPAEVGIGEIILIRPGERVPLDAEVTKGSGAIDTSALTGESMPMDVEPGSQILAGSLNSSGVLEARVEKEDWESTTAKILEMVESAAENKSKSESFITRFARWYTPAVVAAAVIIALLPPLAFGGEWNDWVYRALTFLVVSCPCALVISVPLAFFSGIGKGSRNGILVKGGNCLETLAKADTAVFDKTGTLTKGSFAVAKVIAQGDETELLNIAAAAEQFSTHPIARSILDFHPLNDEYEASDWLEIPGHGIQAKINRKEVLAGNEKLMTIGKISFKTPTEPGTALHVVLDGKYLGCIIIRDEIKPDAQKAIFKLKEYGIDRTVMLTGDNEAAAKAVAEQIGIDEIHASMLPQHKAKIIQKMKKAGRCVMFTGDGINDAPTIACADVGIAMGGIGSDAAIEAADVVIMTDELSKLSLAIKIARKTIRIARENIIFALAVKAAVLILGALGFAPMWLAVFADVGVAVIAILNAIRN